MRMERSEYYLGIAEAVSKRADCSRARVGAVIVIRDRIWATGYNGTKNRGEEGCLSGACPRAFSSVAPYSDYSNCIAVHAEINALKDFGERLDAGIPYDKVEELAQEWKQFVIDNEGMIYVNRRPCSACYQAIDTIGLICNWSHLPNCPIEFHTECVEAS